MMAEANILLLSNVSHQQTVFSMTIGNHWCQRGNTVTQLKEEHDYRTSRASSFSVAGLEKGKNRTQYLGRVAELLEALGGRRIKNYKAFGFSLESPAPISSLHT